MFDGIVDGMELLVVFTLLEIHIAFGCDVAVGNDIVDKFILIVDDGDNAELIVFVYPELRLIVMLADMEDVA